jgi:tRNA/rRNA methyltransferase
VTDQPVVVLVEPQLPENVGTAARAMLNCGLERMRLVTPRFAWPSERAAQTSSGADRVLEQASVHRSLAEATADLNRLYATSARPRDLIKPVLTPRGAASELRAACIAGDRVGVLFGPERTGLLNEDIALCDAVIAAPVNPAFASLNLAQAVLLIGWEWLMAADSTPPRILRHGTYGPAARHHLASFLARLEAELDACGFFRVAEKRPGMLDNIRGIFTRAELTDQELRTLHGIVTELVTLRVDGRPVAREPQRETD